MQKARGQAFPLRGIALPPLVGMWFQVQCPPLVGVLPIFRSRYSFAIGRQRVLSLAGWSPQIRTHFHVLSRTQDTARPLAPVAYGAFTLYGRPFQAVRLGTRVLNAVLQPRRGKPPRFGLFRFRSPLLTESRFLSLPPGNEMFQFPGLARVSRDQSSFDSSPGLIAVFHALIAFWRQDIPHTPLLAWPHCSRPRLVSPRREHERLTSYHLSQPPGTDAGW